MWSLYWVCKYKSQSFDLKSIYFIYSVWTTITSSQVNRQPVFGGVMEQTKEPSQRKNSTSSSLEEYSPLLFYITRSDTSILKGAKCYSPYSTGSRLWRRKGQKYNVVHKVHYKRRTINYSAPVTLYSVGTWFCVVASLSDCLRNTLWQRCNTLAVSQKPLYVLAGTLKSFSHQ